MSLPGLELRHALRRLRKAPAFALGVLLTLGLCIAANATIAVGVESVLLRALPFRDPGTLVWVWATRVDRDKAFFSLPNFGETVERLTTLTDVVGLSTWGANLTASGPSIRLTGVRATAALGSLLGVRPAVGRMLEAADDDPGHPPVVLLSHAVWASQFGKSPGVVGTTITLDGEPVTVVGVLPEDFSLPNLGTEILGPLRGAVDPRRNERGSNFLRLIARVRPGSSPAAAASELASITADLRDRYPEENAKLTPPRVIPLRDELVGAHRDGLLLVAAAALVLLLIATANLSSLFLARSAARRGELAVRWALGASRMQLLGQLGLEASLLAAGGAGLGLALAAAGKDVLRRLAPADMPRLSEIGLNWQVGLYVGARVLLVTTLLVATEAAAVSSPSRLDDLGTGRTASRTALRLRAVLVSSESALAALLLLAAGLLLRSEAALLRVDPGFRSDGLQVARIAYPVARHRTPADLRQLTDALVERLEADGRGTRAALINIFPLSGMNARTDFDIVGRPSATRAEQPAAQTRWVSPGYFEVAGVPLRDGRTFTRSDDAVHPLVVVVDEALARTFWPDRSPVGESLRVAFTGEPERIYQVIGVVASVKHVALDERPLGTLYASVHQVPPQTVPYLALGLNVLLRSDAPAPGLARSLAGALAAVDPQIATSPLRSGESLLAGVLAARRSAGWLVGLFAGAALGLALAGVYAVLSYALVQRRRELAIRSVLGASPGSQFRMVLGAGLRWVLAGALIGTLVGAVASRAFAHQLFGVAPGDPWTLASVLALLASTAALASLHPALRAARAAPAGALAAE